MPRPLDDSLTLGSGVVCEKPEHQLREACLEIAMDFALAHHEDPPFPYVAYVQDRILENVFAAVEGTRVESLATFARGRESSAAAERYEDATEVLR